MATTKKPAAKKMMAAKSAPAKESAAPELEPAAAQAAPAIAKVAQDPTVRRREFVQRVAARTALRPNQVRAAVEATLVELADALAKGERLNIRGFGKLTVKRRNDAGQDAEAMVLRLRRKKETAPLAEPAE